MGRWSWLGAQLFAAATLASIAYLLYAASITFVVGREPFYLITSTLLLVLEVAALTLSLSYLFEIVDTTSRTSDRPHPVDSNYLPRVAIQVPAYNEPLEVMTETLNALAQLDYPDLIIQVVDNNTPDRENWTALKKRCEELGPRFQFMHLENWPGFKAGALNEATRRLPKEVEIVGVVDSDYVVRPDWLRAVIGHFADSKVAFVQTPQNYRDWTDDQYLRGLYYSYRYFFEITMPSRAHRSEEHTSELQSRQYLVCRLLLEKKNIPERITLLPRRAGHSVSFQPRLHPSPLQRLQPPISRTGPATGRRAPASHRPSPETRVRR